MQAVHQAEIGGAVQLEHPRGLLMLVYEDDGPPASFAEFLVDAGFIDANTRARNRDLAGL